MGRHTLHVDAEAKVSHYVCDYTGIPMKGPGCFMPFWKTPTSRMTKRGNYCCWEAVLQHARATADRCRRRHGAGAAEGAHGARRGSSTFHARS